MAKFQLDILLQHSNGLALESSKIFKQEKRAVKEAFQFLSNHFDSLSRAEKSHQRNVKMALTGRFINHLLSYLILVQRGLLLDAHNCIRTATEASAFYWLVCIDPSSASLYDAPESPRPVDIRKRLEAKGIDVAIIRDDYALFSSVAHVGNRFDNLQIAWKGNDGKLLIGGAANPDLQRTMFKAIGRATAIFMKHDPLYVVTIQDETSQIAVAEEP